MKNPPVIPEEAQKVSVYQIIWDHGVDLLIARRFPFGEADFPKGGPDAHDQNRARRKGPNLCFGYGMRCDFARRIPKPQRIAKIAGCVPNESGVNLGTRRLNGGGSSSQYARRTTTNAQDIPMLRHLAQPLDASVLHPHIGVQALGDGVADDGLALLLQQVDQLLLLGDQGVDFRGFLVEEGGDGLLLGNWGSHEVDISEL